MLGPRWARAGPMLGLCSTDSCCGVLLLKLSLFVMPAAVEAAVAQADVAEGGLQPAASGDSQQRGSTPDATADAGDAADSGLSKSGRKAPSKGTRKLPAGQAVGDWFAVSVDRVHLGCFL